MEPSLGELENLILGPSATTRFLPNGNIGLQYSAQLAATGGTAPYTWALAPTSPGLPGGLNISSEREDYRHTEWPGLDL